MSDAARIPTSRRRVRRSIPVLLVGEVLARVKGLLLIPLLTRYFPTSEYGAFAQSSVLVAVLMPLIFLGSESGVARVLPGLDDDARRSGYTAWFLSVMAMTLAWCGAMLLAHSLVERLLYGRAGLYESLVPIIVASIAVAVPVNMARLWLRLREQVVPLTVATAAQAVLSLAAIALVLLTNGSVRLLLAASVAADAVLLGGLMGYLTIRRSWRRPDFHGIRPILRYGLPLLPIGYAIWGMNWFDRLVLVDQRGLTDVGLYSLAYAIAYFGVQILANPVWILFPFSSAHLYDTGQHRPLEILFRKSVMATLLAVAPFIAITTVAGGELIDLFAPHRYVAGRHVIPLVMAGYLAQMLSSYYEVSLGLLHKQWHSTVGTGIGLVVNVVVNLVLIPSIGITGAAIATLAGFSVQLLYIVTVATRARSVGTELVPLLRIVAAGAISGLAAAAFHRVVPAASGPLLIITTVAGLAAYAIALIVGRAVTIQSVRHEARTLRHSFGRV